YAMQTFNTIESALAFVVKSLIPIGHGYVVNVVGPNESEANRAATIQVVAQHMVFEDLTSGLTLNLPFDPSSGEFAHLVEFIGSSISDLCDEYKWEGVPCFALRFGTNVDIAVKAIRFVLAEVYGYRGVTTFKCEVFGEGPIEPSCP